LKLEFIQMTSKRPYWFILLLLILCSARADDTFPLPAELQPDVDFWVDIFSRYSTQEAVLHDNRNLAVVYEAVPMPSTVSRRERDRRVAGRRTHIQAILDSLASGKRENLSEDEARILALWPEGVSNTTLAAAKGQIRHQQGLKDRFRQGLIRSGRWRSYIDAEFRALGVPVEMAALPHVESSYNPNARSNVGASGIWQFTRSTGRRFMQIDHVLDERNDPFEATRAAGKLLAYNYSVTGNWPMAITAYNHGLGGVRRAMREFGDTAYVDIMRKYKGRTFGFASRNFYVAFVAAKQVDQNVAKYFPGVVVEIPVNYAITELPDFVAITDLTSSLGVTTSLLSAHNLALQATVMQESKYLPKGMSIRIPASSIDGSIDSLVASAPADMWHPKQLPDLFHTIARGDTLSEIADTYDTRVSTLVALNNLGSSNRIRAGQQLRLPAAGPAPVQTTQSAATEPVVVATVVAPVESEVLAQEAAPPIDAGDVAASLLGAIQNTLLADPSDYSVAPDSTIEVQPLETLGHYADWLGIRTQRLRDINGMAFRTPVAVGKRLRLDLSTVDAQSFESLRVAYHQTQQDSFFRQHVITGVTEHVIRSGESIWILALREYDVPVWLFRQYNPEVDMENVRPGTRINMPVLVSSGQN
jgi:membrane-bound lytic murein transglycosylase D